MDYSLLIGLHTLQPDEIKINNGIDEDATNPNQFLFYKDFNGGFQSSFEDNSSGPEVYYLGRIKLN